MSARRPYKTATSAEVTSLGVAAFNNSPLVQSLRKQALLCKKASISSFAIVPSSIIVDVNTMISEIMDAASVRKVNNGRIDRQEIIKKVLSVMGKIGLTPTLTSKTFLHIVDLEAISNYTSNSTNGIEEITNIYKWVKGEYTFGDADSDVYYSAEED